MLIQPKPYLNNFRLRRKAEGVERRRNMSKIILEQGTPFPKPISYADIDQTFFEWVDKVLDLSYNGKRLPTYKLFSNQRISEYSQTWSNLDETGNIIMNFKTITRDNNPQHGELNDGDYNVPGHRDYPMFAVPTLQENGEEAYDLYSMKQPFAINFIYKVTLITNKYELLNELNQLMNYEFQSLECYISPNGHPMPMILDDIGDESEYTIDDRKYYAQSYNIKLMGYIIRKEDYKITKVPSRYIVRLMESKTNKGFRVFKRDSSNDLVGKLDKPYKRTCEVFDSLDLQKEKPNIVINEEDLPVNKCHIDEEGRYYNRNVVIEITFPNCINEAKFIIDTDVELTDIVKDNIKSFDMEINDEKVNFDNDVVFVNGDIISLKIDRKDDYKSSTLTIVGYNPNIVLDKEFNPESQLDDVVKMEHLKVNADDEFERIDEFGREDSEH